MSEKDANGDKDFLDELDELDNYMAEPDPEADPEAEPESEPEPEPEPEPASDSSSEPELESEPEHNDPGDPKDEPKKDTKKESEEIPEGEESAEEGKKEGTEDSRYEKLLAQINDLKGELAKKQSPAEELEISEIDFMEGISVEDLGTDLSVLNKIFNKVLKESIKNSAQNVPQKITQQIEESMNAHEISMRFYSENQDLSNVRNVVKACAEQIVSEHEDWEVGQILEESAKRARESLGMPVPGSGAGNSKISNVDKAAFSEGSKGSRQPVKKDSALQQELDEM